MSAAYTRGFVNLVCKLSAIPPAFLLFNITVTARGRHGLREIMEYEKESLDAATSDSGTLPQWKASIATRPLQSVSFVCPNSERLSAITQKKASSRRFLPLTAWGACDSECGEASDYADTLQDDISKNVRPIFYIYTFLFFSTMGGTCKYPVRIWSIAIFTPLHTGSHIIP